MYGVGGAGTREMRARRRRRGWPGHCDRLAAPFDPNRRALESENMTAESLHIGRRIAVLIAPLLLAAAACKSGDVGEADKSGTGTTSGVGERAAAGSGGVDTAGSAVNPNPAGSLVTPGGADSAAKAKANPR